MNPDPLNIYRSMMTDTKVPENLTDRVLRQARGQADQGNPASSNGSTSKRPAPYVKRSRTKVFAIAACTALTLGIGTFALSSLVGTSGTGGGGDTAHSVGTIPGPFDFTVAAYASSTNTLLSFGPDGSIVFDSSNDLSMPSSASVYQNEGMYLKSLFRVQGDNVSSVSASIDRGQLYSYTAEEFVKSSDPDRWTAALNWKPSKVGSGGVYGSYDYVQPQSTNDGLDRGDPNKLCRVALSSLLGQSTTITGDNLAAMAAGNYNIGFWTNEDPDGVYSGTGDFWNNEFFKAIDTLDGAHLTITTTFLDGSTSTKVIELHSADLKAETVPAEYGGTRRLQVIPEFAGPDDKANGTFIHGLYGDVADESYSPAAGTDKKAAE